MINIEGLRIGNYILGPDSTSPERFTIDWFHAIEINAITEEELTPISLSPEILEKCGFEKWDNTYQLDCADGENIQVRGNEIFLAGAGACTDDHGFHCKAEYLHQLQNLFFALTGEELKVNLTEPQLT